jgi:hypothetical protein
MSKAITLVVVCGLAGLVTAYAMVPGENPRQAAQQRDVMIGDQETSMLLAVASAAWKTASRSGTPAGTERASATEVVTIPVVRGQDFTRKTSPMPGDRASLAQDLQRELARVGCYDGQINGVWTTSTRQAMKAFLERVNATLPLNEPDEILLALVRGQRVMTCGTTCPSGQALTDDGRCMPTAILSREAKKDHAKKVVLATSGWSTTTTVAPKLSSAPLEGQMALAGPKAESTAGMIKAEPAQPPREVPPSGRDWRSELWKRQQANR